MKNNGILVVISGFSGAGKGTLVRKLMEKYDNYSLSVSMTTRDKRDGEEDGVHYFFVDHRKFEQTIIEDGLLEYAIAETITEHLRSMLKNRLKQEKTLSLKSKYRELFRLRRNSPTRFCFS